MLHGAEAGLEKCIALITPLLPLICSFRELFYSYFMCPLAMGKVELNNHRKASGKCPGIGGNHGAQQGNFSTLKEQHSFTYTMSRDRATPALKQDVSKE